MQAFRPILEPAFVDDYQSRVHLTAALNAISNRDLNKGLKKLESLVKACVTDEDKAAWLFFMGLCFEFAGNKEEMIHFYSEAGTYRHRFYLPYLKLAKSAHNDAIFEVAEENYCAAIGCFEGATLDEQSKMIVGSAYTNLSSCLTMMHRYEEAEDALEKSRQLLPVQPGREASEAILYAVAQKEEMAEACLEKLSNMPGLIYEETKKLVEKILAGQEPQFCELPVDEEEMEEFWDVFCDYEESLRDKLKERQNDEVISWIDAQLTTLFPFVERPLEFGILMEEGYYQLELADFYAVSLQRGYEKLLELCPEELKAHWKFVIIH